MIINLVEQNNDSALVRKSEPQRVLRKRTPTYSKALDRVCMAVDKSEISMETASTELEIFD